MWYSQKDIILKRQTKPPQKATLGRILILMKTENSKYRWYMLGLAMMAYLFIAGMSRMCMPVLFKEISTDLGLSMVAIGVVWGMDPLAGVFIGLPGGLIADRFGVRLSMTVVCILAGLFGALRGLSINFLTMSASMFLFGLMAATMPTIVPKVTAQWFSGKGLGISNAVLNIMWSVGAMTATMFSATFLSPLLGGWKMVMFLYGMPCVILGILWYFTGKEPESNGTERKEDGNSVSFKNSLSHVLRIRNVWIIGLVTLTFWGSSMGMIGYLPLYLRTIGWSPVSADSAITILSGISIVGSVPVVLLSERLGSRKAVLIISIILGTLTLLLLPILSGLAVWILLIINGFMRTGVFALFNVIILEMKEVGSRYGGTAIGLVSSFGMIGAFAAPPLGNSLTIYSPGLPFTFWAVLSLMGLPLFMLVRGTEKR